MKRLMTGSFTLFLILFAFSCKKEQGTEPSAGKNAFDPPQLELWVDRDTLRGDDTLTIFFRCYPVFSGKGRMLLDKGLKRVLTPSTFWEDSSNYYSAATFAAGVPFLTHWQVQIVSTHQYSGPLAAFAGALMDSVYGADSTQLFHIRSEEAERIYGKIGGVGAGAYPIPSITYFP